MSTLRRPIVYVSGSAKLQLMIALLIQVSSGRALHLQAQDNDAWLDSNTGHLGIQQWCLAFADIFADDCQHTSPQLGATLISTGGILSVPITHQLT